MFCLQSAVTISWVSGVSPEDSHIHLCMPEVVLG